VVGDRIRQVLESLGIDVEYRVISAHRHPDALEEYVRSSKAEVFVAVAGLSAALPGFIASRTLKPVIGVPRSAALGGLGSLVAAMIAGLFIGVVEVFSGFLIGPESKQAIYFLVFIAVLVIRPSGLFGEKGEEELERIEAIGE